MSKLTNAAELFASEGMLIHYSYSGHCIIDRWPMRKREAKSPGNLHNRWQVLNADQTQYKLFRKLDDALEFCDQQRIIFDACKGYLRPESVLRIFHDSRTEDEKIADEFHRLMRCDMDSREA